MTLLSGKRIVVTRAKNQADEFANMLKTHSAIPILYPCIEIALPENTSKLDNALLNLSQFDWLVLTSSNTIRTLAGRIKTLNLKPNWKNIKIAVVGSKTAELFEQLFSQSVDFMPTTFDAETLGLTIPVNPCERILLPQSAIANTLLSKILIERGAIVDIVTAYQTVIGKGGEDISKLLHDKLTDVLTFTSPSTVEYFIKRINPLTAFDIPTVCIGATTAESAHKNGFQTVMTAHPHTLEDMIDTLLTFFSEVQNVRN